jgi:hypothetical protein
VKGFAGTLEQYPSVAGTVPGEQTETEGEMK